MDASSSSPPTAKPGRIAAALAPLLQALRPHWQALGARERLAVQVAGAALGLLLLWWLAVAPALRTLRQAPLQLTALESQLQQMQALAAESRELRAQPAVSPVQARQALEAISAQLGAAGRLSITGERAVLTLDGVDGGALQGWLGAVRSAGRARPVEVSLRRGPQGYSGSIVLSLGTSAP